MDGGENTALVGELDDALRAEEELEALEQRWRPAEDDPHEVGKHEATLAPRSQGSQVFRACRPRLFPTSAPWQGPR